jgi:hypothetical protein
MNRKDNLVELLIILSQRRNTCWFSLKQKILVTKTLKEKRKQEIKNNLIDINLVLSNLIITDYIDFHFYRDGVLKLKYQ